jgi:hypothetical protein
MSMAQKVHIVLTDDLDGNEADETVTFALDNTTYEIDLSKANAKDLRKALDKYVSAGRKVTGGRSTRGSRTSAGSGRSSEELAAIREWAKQKGHEVSERGRIKKDVLDAYAAAH